MADWTTISSLATAGGTLVLAVATFSAVRSANRSTRIAQLAFQETLRPVLMPSRLADPPEKVMWREGHWTRVEGGRGVVEEADDNIFFVISVRNAGAGIAVLQGWQAAVARFSSSELQRPELDTFRRQLRDLYIAPGDTGSWQGAIRDHDDASYNELHDAIAARERLVVYLLYSDHEGGQRSISLFSLSPADRSDRTNRGDRTVWLTSVVRHWNLDRADPRST
jgi:hypothetical protein